MKETVRVLREGEVKLVLPGAEIRTGGTVWCNGIPVIDGQSQAAKDVGIDAINAAVKMQDWASIPKGAYGRMGMSESGLEIITADEHEQRTDNRVRAKLAARTPAQIERDEIEGMYADAEDCRDYPGDYFRLLGRAKARLEAWKEQYPAAATEEHAQELRSAAEEKRSLASGALVYDADGSLDNAEQHRRHDEFVAEAEKLEREAAALSSA